MATNTLTGMVLARAGQIVLGQFVKRMLPLRLFSTDISPDAGVKGDTVQVPLITAASAATDLQDDHSGVRSDATQNSVSSTVSVTMNKQPINGFELKDEEMQKIHENFLPGFLLDRAIQCANSVANSCHSVILNLMTAANYTNTPFTILAANFDLDAVIGMSSDLADDDWPVDDVDSTPIIMGLKPSYYAKLKQDNAIQDASASNMDVARTGRLNRRVDIFDVYQNARIPPSGGTPASENLTGFIAQPAAVAWAQRTVTPQDETQLTEWDVLTDEQTGLSLSYRSWYDPDKGKRYFTYETLFGASKGNPSHLTRIRSAA